jgi:hypothetical protein
MERIERVDRERLSSLDLAGLGLESLPKQLENLTQLSTLDLHGNRLTALPDWLGDLTQLSTLDLHGNPLWDPPPEVVVGGTTAVLAFLRDRVGGTERVWRSKLLVVGEATVGKTTLAKQLTGGAYDPGEKQTHGVHIDDLREAVQRHAAALPLMGASWPRTWIDAARRIAALEGHAAPAATVWQAMSDAGVGDPRARRALARALHDLGDIVFFADDAGLNEKVILDPTWLDERITQLLDSDEVTQARGVLSRAERARLWQGLDPDLHDRLLRMMERFDLAFRIGDSETSEDVALIVERIGYAQPPQVAPLWQHALDTPGAHEVGLDFSLRSRQAGIPSWLIARQHHHPLPDLTRIPLIRHRTRSFQGVESGSNPNAA